MSGSERRSREISDYALSLTLLCTEEGWLYLLTVVIDLWSHAVIGWSMSSRMTAQLACDALQMALWWRKRPQNVVVHTDSDSQSNTVQQISGTVEEA